MDSMISLVEPQKGEGPGLLTEELAQMYAGNLWLPSSGSGKSARQVVFANFVSSLDGAVAYNLPDYPNGGVISGGHEGDHFIMGVLRACADAVVVGASSVRSELGAPRTASVICPGAESAYQALRLRSNMGTNPLNVILSATGDVDFSWPIFHVLGLNVLVLAAANEPKLRQQASRLPSTSIRGVGRADCVDPQQVLKVLKEEFGISRCLLEGGPRVLGAFLKEGLIDELFLTLSPRVVGRSSQSPRPGFAEGVAFGPEDSPQAELVSLRQQGSYLFTRYRFVDTTPSRH